jgi:hypothetical protein
MGVVNSKTWSQCYLTIKYGILRIYDDKETSIRNPDHTIMQMVLDEKRRPSHWKMKNYSKSSDKVINFYSFYILKDNDFMNVFMYKRKVKFGSTTLEETDKLIRCIEANTKNKASERVKQNVL